MSRDSTLKPFKQKTTMSTFTRLTNRLPNHLLIGIALSFVSIPAWGQIDVSSDLETIRINRHMPGISAMVVKEGRIMAQGAAGYRRQGNSAPLLVSDPINIASCTKWMTATIAGRLVDRGAISWDTRVRDVFTNYQTFHASFHNATLDQLLAHRAGVQQGSTFQGNHWSQLMAQSGTIFQIRNWVSETVLKDAPEVAPGNYLYSNQGYTVAGTMMEIATGKDWETLIREEVFSPLRMTTATLGQVYDSVLPPKAPVGHDLALGQTVPVARTPMNAATHFRYQASNAPGGFVACSLRDWAKFLHMHATSDNSNYLTLATSARLQQPYTGSEGYGRGIYAVNRSWATPGQALNHSGDIFGQDTVVWMAPARDFIVIVFANCRSADNSTSLALDDAASLLVSRFSSAVAIGPFLEEKEEPSPPEIEVRQPVSSNLVDGVAMRRFGRTKVGATGITKKFTIKNTGLKQLAGLTITKTGSQKRDFIITAPAKTSLAFGATTTFKVTFKPTARGTRNAVLHIKSNDADENPFDIKLTGLGAPP